MRRAGRPPGRTALPSHHRRKHALDLHQASSTQVPGPAWAGGLSTSAQRTTDADHVPVVPAAQRYKRLHNRWQRYVKRLRDHRVQIDVKFVHPCPASPRAASTTSSPPSTTAPGCGCCGSTRPATRRRRPSVIIGDVCSNTGRVRSAQATVQMISSRPVTVLSRSVSRTDHS